MASHRAGRTAARGAGGLAALGVLAMGASANAQSGSSTLSSFQQGYNGGLSTFEQAVNVSTYVNGTNTVFVDGVSQIGSDGSVFAQKGSTSGASDSYSGAGGAAGSATAIGNNLSVNVSGNYNTVVVNSTQTNNGNVSATTILNGKVNLDGGQ
jgi:holdfast attachment protein HfaA